MTDARTLPLRVDPAPGEAFDSWLLRLAHRNAMPLRWLTAALGFGDRLRVWHNYALSWNLPPTLLRRIETQTGLPPGSLDTAMLDQYDMLGWKPIPGSRFCPACLRESGGIWPIRWQLPYTFACLTHHSLLAVLCPLCRRTPHSQISERSGLAAPTRCALATRHGPACDGDLLTHPPQPLNPADPRLRAQAWINTRIDHPNPSAVTDLRDLNALAAWLLHRVNPGELQHLGPATVTAITEHRDGLHAIKRHPPTAALIAAAMASQAVDLITADDHQRASRAAPLLRNVYTQLRAEPPRPARGPMILSHQRLSRLSEPLRCKILTSIDAQLPVSERLRYRTCTTTPNPPATGSRTAAERARHIPQHLWPDWLIRFLPRRGAHVTQVAIDIPKALLIPGNPERNLHATAELGPWSNNTSIFLGQCTDEHPDTLAAICALADYLDTHGSPIDYRRRRATFTDITLTTAQWHELCYHAHSNPGREGHLRNARRYLFQLLTGADLDNTRHPLAFTTSSPKTTFQRFCRDLSTPLRDALHRHGDQLLDTAGIDEPVTWSPPGDCVAELKLPGREPDDLDPDAVRHALDIEHLTPTAAARRLGVTTEHIRYAQQQLYQAPRPLAATSPTRARQHRDHAATLLTRDFFEREFLRSGHTLRTLAASIEIPYAHVARCARDHAIPSSNRKKKDQTRTRRAVSRKPRRATAKRKTKAKAGNRPPVIDPTWLHEQAGNQQRANTDIAAELGLSHETVRRHRAHLGIAARPTGSAGHTLHTRRHPDLPVDIRNAAEGQRHGWQRLRRFQHIAAHCSVNAAAGALGLHQQNVFLQLDRLEHDVGATLLRRTNNRYQPMTLTKRGQRLLGLLNRPDVQQLLDRYAPHQTGPAKTSPRSTRTRSLDATKGAATP